MHRFISMVVCLMIAVLTASAGDLSPGFQQRCMEMSESAGGTLVVRGDDGWLFLTSELRHLGVGPFWGEHAAAASKATRPDAVDPLPAKLGRASCRARV